MNAFCAALNQPIGLVSPVMPLMLSYLPTPDNLKGRVSVAGGGIGIAPTAGGLGKFGLARGPAMRPLEGGATGLHAP